MSATLRAPSASMPDSRAPALDTTGASEPSARRAHLRHGQLARVDDELLVEVERAAAHRDVEVAGGVVRAAELVVRADGEHDVAVEAAQLHAHAAAELGEAVPVGALVEAPADV